MKKSLFLLPVLAIAALAGCDNGGNDDPVKPNPPAHTHVDADKNCYCDTCFQPIEHVDANADYVCDVCGADLPGKPVPVTDLKVTLDYATISAAIGTSKTGYDAVAGVTSIADHSVSFVNVCINNLNSASQPKWTTPNDEKVQVIQFKNPNTAAGVITFPSVKVGKVTINLLTSYDIDADFTVSYGSAVVPMKADEGVATQYKSVSGEKSFDIKKFALTFEVNGTEGADLVIKNQGKGARYVESIVIE